MSFSLSSKDIRLEGSKLIAWCQRRDCKTWVFCTIDLNHCLGNTDGKFDVESGGWHQSAVRGKTVLYGTVLRTYLYTRGKQEEEAWLDLDHHVANVDGVLTFHKEAKIPEVSKGPLSLFTLSGSVLKAVRVEEDGKSHFSERDLDSYYGNQDGHFVPDQVHFSRSARNVCLKVDGSSVTLCAELLDRSGEYRSASVDVPISILREVKKVPEPEVRKVREVEEAPPPYKSNAEFDDSDSENGGWATPPTTTDGSEFEG
ncbi:Cyanovirin-N [Lasiosphaeria hispida]|uniref:Cyanovirin-N n=1 Tax=Lasiosphaeria hispida TaxID=260671 RepID=A0AAJ0HE62_9PEZI|nr:Cyanovirin-N [Lasiosphaeria hispida]